METKDNTPLVGGILVALAIVGLIILGAMTLAGRGTGDEVMRESSSGLSDMKGSGSSPSGNDTPVSSTDVQEGRVAIDIDNFKFMPAQITVKKGTTVTWTNRDTARHDVTPVENSDGAPRSELMGQNESYSHTFDTIGTFAYYCSPHPYMKASVTVVE